MARSTALTEPGIKRIVNPETEKPEFVFTTTGRRPVSGFSKTAARLRAAVAAKAQELTLDVELDFRWHDLRRSVRSEFSRLGVSPPVSERILNHAGDALERTYDVYKYDNEKREALDRWAAADHRECKFIFMRGNHDASRDTEVTSWPTWRSASASARCSPTSSSRCSWATRSTPAWTPSGPGSPPSA